MSATRPPLPKATLNDGQNLFFTEAVLRAFVAEAVAAEREQCAQVVDEAADLGSVNISMMKKRIARAIRARKDTT